MALIKDKLLSLYTQRLIKSKNTVRTNVGFQKAQQVGILYQQENPHKDKAVQWLANQLAQHGKKVALLCYATHVPQVITLSVPTITYRDIKFTGKIAHLKAKKFIETPFDYLYQVDLSSYPALDYLMAKSQAKCRVGHYTATKTGLFEIMVRFESKTDSHAIDNLTTQMLHYTKQLKAQ